MMSWNKNILRLVVLSSFFLVSSARAQLLPFSLGVKGGVGLTDAYLDSLYTNPDANAVRFNSSSKDYIVGPFAEVRLPFHLSVEVDALYRPLSLQTMVIPPTPSNIGTIVSSTRNATWEFPILGKYTFSGLKVIRPFLDAGPSFRTTTSDTSTLSNHGFAAGAGLDFHLLVLRISPEVRYYHWGADSISSVFEPPRSAQNQAEFLVGVSF